MFAFKAYFWDSQVYIGGQAYRTNEILTECLNLSEPEDYMRDRLYDLEELLPLVQILDDDYNREKNYNRNVQRAQDLFFDIGNILQRLPPYKNLPLKNRLDQPLLFECLNKNYRHWETGDYENDADSINEYGFVEKNENGYYNMFVQSFQPDPMDVELCVEDHNIFSDLNQAVEDIFTQFTNILKDLLRVKIAYADFLDNYIHGKNKFLGDGETAACFIKYMECSKRRHDYERVISSSSMQMSHEVYCRPDGREKLCEAYTFDSLGSFLYFDFFRGLSRDCIPKRCGNCGMYFLLDGGKYSSYCERPLKDDPEKTCRDVGARKRYDDKCRTDPVWLAYNRAYKAHYARYMKRKMTVSEFEEWSRYAVELRSSAENGKMELAEYQRLLKK